jgi:hypothetical protein
VRWIFPGQLAGAVAGWFGRFPTEQMVLDDAYLLDPYLPGLSVKVREGRALEVKVFRGSPGLFEVAGRAHGRLECWQKWSFPHGLPSSGSGDPAGWRPVSKRRQVSWFSRVAGVRVPRLSQKPGCAVELTDVRVRGEAWWTLGFEATGPPDTLRGELDAAAGLLFAHPLPDAVELGMDDSRSYAQWLSDPTGLRPASAGSPV